MKRTAKLVPNAAAKQVPGLEVLTAPNFIVEKDGELYLAVGVLKYSEREAAAEADEALRRQKQEGVARVRKMFVDGINADHTNLDCCEAQFASTSASMLESGEGDTPPGMNTEPPGMNTSP